MPPDPKRAKVTPPSVLVPEALDTIARFVQDQRTLDAFLVAMPTPMLSPALVALQDLITAPDASLRVDWPTVVLQRAPALASTTANLHALLPLQPSLSVVAVAGTDLVYLGPLVAVITAMTVEFRSAQTTNLAWTHWVRDFGRRCPRLRELHVVSATHTAPVPPLLDVLAHSALRFLTLQSVSLNGASVTKLLAWLQRGTARGLRLNDVPVGETDALLLCDALSACASLVELRVTGAAYLSGHLLDGRSLPPNLRVFAWGVYDRDGIRSTPAPVFNALHHMSQLHTLNLSGNRVLCPNAIAELLPYLPHLRNLDVSKAKFAPPGDVVHLIAAMGQRPSLQYVSVSQCKLPHSMMPPLVACIPAWPLLRRLDLAGLYVPARAFRAMVTALVACPDFAFLRLRFPPFTDAMWRSIMPTLGPGVLRWRRVAFSDCTPTAVQVVQFLRRLLEHNQQAFTVTCDKFDSASALQTEYGRLLHELGLLPPTRDAARCVVAFEHLK